MTGTPNQIEWAEQIKLRVNAEFDRVANALKGAAVNQSELDRLDTHSAIAILEEKRLQVLANSSAGYFIKEWQELTDRVWQMIARDSRHREIKAGRAARRLETHGA